MVSVLLDRLPVILLVTAIVLFLVLPTWIHMLWEDRRTAKAIEEAAKKGEGEPVSIRPHVDPNKCVGSGLCVAACPEKDVLRLVGSMASIVRGSHCVGHGACAASCPTEAITLVFGTEQRGVDLPEVAPDFQTDVEGLYIAGELGGMGLIANATRQGVQAMQEAGKGLRRDPAADVDVVIVGAGPAGIAAALEAVQQGLAYALVEQETFGGAIRHYPRQKVVMSRPIALPGYGKPRLGTIRKEALVELFEDVVARTGLEISQRERVDAVAKEGTLFRVKTSQRELTAPRVLLTVGRRGTPRRLGVPGEDAEKVAYRLIDPERYEHQHLLVVGGGDSAVEAAMALGAQGTNKVTLSYRKDNLSRPRPANTEALEQAVAAGQVELLLGSVVKRIDPDRVHLAVGDRIEELANDFVFVFAGGVLPTQFLRDAGVTIRRHHGTWSVEA